MKNKIEKIVLSMKDEKTLNGIIVKNDKGIEIYGFGEISQDELNKKYLNIIKTLKRQSYDELEDIESEQEIINKLYQLNKIVITKETVLVKIASYFDEKDELSKFITYTSDGKQEHNKKDFSSKEEFLAAYGQALTMLCNTFGIEFNDKSKDQLEKIGLLEEKNISDEKNDKKEKHGILNLMANHKFITALLLTGTVVLITKIPGCQKQTSKVYKISKTPVPTPKTTIAPNRGVIDYGESVEEFKEIYIDGEEDLFPYYETVSSDTLIAKTVNGVGYRIGSSSFDSTYENLHSIRNSNLSTVGNHVQSGKTISDKGVYIYYENKLNNQSLKDKAYVKYFSMIGNSIIHAAYEDDDKEMVGYYSRLSASEVVSLIQDDKPLHVYIYGQLTDIYYSELSKEAKDTVLNIAWANNLPLNKDIISSHGVAYNQDGISDIIIDKAEELNIIK